MSNKNQSQRVSRHNRSNNPVVQEGLDRNQSRICDVPGCHWPRYGFSKYCQFHRYSAHFHGDPKGRALVLREYKGEKEMVREIIERNQNHPGVQHVIDQIEGILSQCRVNPKVPADVKRFAHQDHVSPMDVLIEAAAVCVFDALHPRRFKNHQAFLLAVGHRILSLIPTEMVVSKNGKHYHTQSRPHSRKYIAELIWKAGGRLFINIVKSMEHKEEQEEHAKKLMDRPLV